MTTWFDLWIVKIIMYDLYKLFIEEDDAYFPQMNMFQKIN
jgi:hypothetical protein